MQWTVDTVAAVDAEIDSLPVALRRPAGSLAGADVGSGPGATPGAARQTSRRQTVGTPGKGPRGLARGIYVTATGRRVVVLHVFAKKSRKTRGRALDAARKRMKEVMR